MALVRRWGVCLVVDVRRFPRSRRHPHFSAQVLNSALPSTGIEYVHMEELGGWRQPASFSPHIGIESDGFRGYADYMLTDAFGKAIQRLQSLAGQKPTALMCAEALWWRCHRSFVADALVARGWQVLHILTSQQVYEHRLPAGVSVQSGYRLIYGEGYSRRTDRSLPLFR